MPADRFVTRRNKLIRQVRRTEAEALLVTDETNVTYLTGFTGDSSSLLIGPDQAVLISDGRYTTQIEEECPDLDVHIRELEKTMIQAVGDVAGAARLQRLGFESRSTSVSQWQRLGDEVKSLQLLPLEGLIEELRQVKDRQELQAIRRAVRLAENGLAALRPLLGAAMTERQAAHELEHLMRRLGATGASFEPIIAAGPRSALPHARPTAAMTTGDKFLLIDWGAGEAAGYKSDLTRILPTAKILPKLEKVHGVVFKAQQQAMAAIRPGVRGEDVDAAARAVIEEAGYGKHFGHALGHGIGLETHEGPRLRRGSTDELKPGMVVTVEPGIYLPGWGGVRLEDDVLVTREGCEVLSSLPKDLESLGLT